MAQTNCRNQLKYFFSFVSIVNEIWKKIVTQNYIRGVKKFENEQKLFKISYFDLKWPLNDLMRPLGP